MCINFQRDQAVLFLLGSFINERIGIIIKYFQADCVFAIVNKKIESITAVLFFDSRYELKDLPTEFLSCVNPSRESKHEIEFKPVFELMNFEEQSKTISLSIKKEFWNLYV